jgi:hypothetical protein
LLKLNILITSFITTIVSLLICGVWDFPLTCLNLVNIIYWLGMTIAWHGKERQWHGMEMEKGNGNGMERKGKEMAWKGNARQGMTWNGMESEGKARNDMERKGMAWHGKERHGLARKDKARSRSRSLFQVLWMVIS